MNRAPFASRANVLVFDLDGTLADTRTDIARAVNHVRTTFALPVLPVTTIVGYVGDGARQLLQRALPSEFHTRMDEAITLWRAFYLAHILEETVLYPGVRETLDVLPIQKMQKAVLSNKPERHCVALLKGLGIHDHFVRIIGGDTFERMKPDPLPMETLCTSIGVPVSNVLMIGDGINDAMIADACNIPFAAAVYGFWGHRILTYKHAYALHTFNDLQQIVGI